MQTKFNPKEKVYIIGTIKDIIINDSMERYTVIINNGGGDIKISADVNNIFPINEDKHTTVFRAGDNTLIADTLGEDNDTSKLIYVDKELPIKYD